MRKKNRNGGLFLVFAIGVIAVVVFFMYKGSIKNDLVDEEELDSWDIHFVDLSASVVGKAEYTLPIFSNTVVQKHSVTINNAGDSVTYQFRVVNDGTQDARLKDIVMSIPKCSSKKEEDEELVCDNLVYELLNEDGTKLKKNVVIKKNTSLLLHLIVEYPSDTDKKLKNPVVIENLDIDLIFSKK